MPRLGAEKGRRGASGGFEADVRLVDYAHASLPSSEARRVSKKVNIATKSIRETRHWWECDEEDFDDDLLDTEHQPDDDDEEDANGLREKGSHRFSSSIGYDQQVDSSQYPIDLWFLISSYIHPEDIGRFALICRRSYVVTRSNSFWRQLYRRYYDPKLANNIPEQFRPLALTRLYGLRTRVVKALHCLYGHFVERSRCSSGVSLSEQAVEKLYKGICESTWWEHQRDNTSGKAVWRFYFKFRARQLSSQKQQQQYQSKNFVSSRHKQSESNRSLAYLDDTWANLEDGCCVLKVTCNQYTQIPMVLGWRLSELIISLCSDMRSHRLRLVFSESGVNKSSSSKITGAKEVAVLDSVQSVAVFDWWHPSYPLAVL